MDVGKPFKNKTQTKQNCCGPELDTASVDSPTADLVWCSAPKLLMLRVCMPPRSDIHSRLVSGKARINRHFKVFFQLRQLRRLRRSFDSEAASTLIRSFVSNRVDYCNCLMAGAPKKWTEKFQRVMNAAARILIQTKKYDRELTRILHDELHCLDVSERIQFKLCIHVYKCMLDIVPKYMMDLCRPISAIEGRNHMRSAARGQLDVPRPKLSTYGKGAKKQKKQKTYRT